MEAYKQEFIEFFRKVSTILWCSYPKDTIV